MSLITLSDAQLAYGHVALARSATALSLESGERLALIGRNGTGKSSLLKVMAGQEKLDDGTLQLQQGLRRYYVPQEPTFADGSNVCLTPWPRAWPRPRPCARAMKPMPPARTWTRCKPAWKRWTAGPGSSAWTRRCSACNSMARRSSSGCRAGRKKRVALAQALVARPDVLLLDEPTNHLDMDAIEWLQGLLSAWRGALVVVSHDRRLHRRRGHPHRRAGPRHPAQLPGSFSTYERTKAQEMESEALLERAALTSSLAQEEVWIRKGVEARRTRSVGRVGRLERLRSERANRRDRVGQVRLELDAGQPPGKIVAELTDVRLAFAQPDGGDKLIVSGFNSTILRGDKIGLVGPNGVGKTTLLKLILGELEPDAGRVRRGTQLQVAYFDQNARRPGPGRHAGRHHQPGQRVDRAKRQPQACDGLPARLFVLSPERANSPVRTLSGGERNRLLLARLFALPANVLVLERAHQRPGHRHAGAAGRAAAVLRRHGVSGQPRPHLSGQRGHQPAGLGG